MKKYRKNIDIHLLIRKYIDEKNSTKDIASMFNVSDRTICYRLKDLGLIRTRREALKISNKNAFTRFQKGQRPWIADHRERISVWNKGRKNLQVAWNKDLVGVQTSNKKGKKFEELYGKDKAEELKKDIRRNRAKQIFPKKDSKIELKIQAFLQALGLEFYTHRYMDITHSYQCDFLIPSMKIVIEADGDYWHNYPNGREIDRIRTIELNAQGYRVIRLWEREIKEMTLEKFQMELDR